MQTEFWGPRAWDFLFCTMANYPIKINQNNPEHVQFQKKYIQLFKLLQYTLPCKWCRMSYKDFIREIPIEPYSDSRRKMLYWLYLIKDKVNKKLLKQESEPGRKGTFVTKKSPSFEVVCKRYEKYRASCSTKTKTCRKPTK